MKTSTKNRLIKGIFTVIVAIIGLFGGYNIKSIIENNKSITEHNEIQQIINQTGIITNTSDSNSEIVSNLVDKIFIQTDEISAMKSEISEKQNEISTIQNKITEMQNEINDLTNEIAAKNDQIDSLNETINLQSAELSALTAENEQLKNSIFEYQNILSSGSNNPPDSGTGNNVGSEKIEPVSVSITDDGIVWLEEIKINRFPTAATVSEKEPWYNCIGLGSSNLNADGNAGIRVVCDEYNRFTAEFAPQDGFDNGEKVTLYIYGGYNGEQTFKEEYQIGRSTSPIKIDVDISGSDELYITKIGNYSAARIAGQYINGYRGMGVLMRDATLYK